MVMLLEYRGSSVKRCVMRKTVSTPVASCDLRNFSAACVVYVATASRMSLKVVIGRPKDRETMKLCFGGGQSAIGKHEIPRSSQTSRSPTIPSS
jgi:hypothetical protein